MDREPKFNLDLPSDSPPLGNSLKQSSVAPASKSAAPTVKADAPAKVPSSPRTARARGEAMGSAFATLNGGDFAKADSFVSAIERGARAAHAQDALEQSIAESPSALREFGFEGVDRDYD